MDAIAPDGTALDLRDLARGVCARYRAEFPDEEERYGDAGQAWCVHDNQYILHWALLDAQGLTKLDDQVAWLGRVLGARDFPLDRLARNLELAADVVLALRQPWCEDIAARLRAAKAAIPPVAG
jgi:hypothetical protein